MTFSFQIKSLPYLACFLEEVSHFFHISCALIGSLVGDAKIVIDEVLLASIAYISTGKKREGWLHCKLFSSNSRKYR